ncbi:MAG: PilN domain-containing protein [Thiomonas sp.]|uniref:PilN domain-containing protein n=1 Tax=Thiomonas TaxID=32012 RepID=UPI001AC6827D|nr:MULTISPECIES: PilN domain-containing protein [Thiomonas]MBN8775453.1 PilN domain-containing protein [Thiomonas arsenitoxydans]MDE2267446.1 PilN domain-containing protein [Betaproteobacteria bacterium]HML80729.1 PilN domain-containing protein [Thiomonas arsenitoxydans]
MNIVLINLLPHRDAKRKKRREAFYAGVFASIVLGGLVLALGYTVLSEMITQQQSRNDFLKAENAKLDSQIKDIASLKAEIEALRARQDAVEGLQADRNLPVHLFDDLTKDTPTGVQLSQIRQDGATVLIQGVALSQERVADFLRNLSRPDGWLEKPELIEIRSQIAPAAAGNAARVVAQFQLRATLKRPTPAGASSGATSGPAPMAKNPS